MRKWLRYLSPVSLPPSNPRELIPWLLFKLLYWLIGPMGLLILGGIIILTTFFAFMIGDYNGSTSGSVQPSTGQVTLSLPSKQKNQTLQQKALQVANTWQNGLTSEEIQQVNLNQVNIPDALLLTVGKMVDNNQNTDYMRYYRYFQPIYRFHNYITTVKTWGYVEVPYWARVKEKNGKYKKVKRHRKECRLSITHITHSLLTYADTWNGTLTLSYQQTSGGTTGCPNGQWTKTWKVASMSRTYSWSKVWNLYSHIKTQTGWVRRNTYNEQIIAGLLAMSDPTLNDPHVQSMVAQLSFLNGGSLSAYSGSANVGVASQNVVQNVLRYKSYINYYANIYQVPPVLIAAQMAQESGGRQHNPDGSLKTSGVGTGNPLDAATGAIGLMQVEPSTAYGLTIVLPSGQTQYVGNEWMPLLANAVANISIGADYIGNLYREFGNIPATLGAYNAGPGAEETALAEGYPYPQFGQTEGYVADITQTWIPAFQPYF